MRRRSPHRSARTALRLSALLASLALLPTLGAAAGRSKPNLILKLDTPSAGALIGDPGGMAFVSGQALALFGRLQRFDIVFTLDTSESTSSPSGSDVNGDGKVEGAKVPGWLRAVGSLIPLRRHTSPDSVLAAEAEAVRTILEQLDPRSTRVGLVTFSGDDDPLSQDAFTVVPLTANYSRVERGLDRVLDDGPHGMTNMVSGVNRALVELTGSPSAYSEPRPFARRVLVFLTDGTPTLPLTGMRLENIRMTISKAMRAAQLKVRIDTYAIGDEALREPVVAVEMARVTGGLFTPVRHPRDLRALFEEMSFADIEALEVRNKTTGEGASYEIRNADGTFSALVPMREGRNTIEVYARATEGSERRLEVSVRFARDAQPPKLGPGLLAQRNRLLENRLLDLRRRSLKIEMERDEAVRRNLKLEIEREREAARTRAEKMRRTLEISPE